MAHLLSFPSAQNPFSAMWCGEVIASGGLRSLWPVLHLRRVLRGFTIWTSIHVSLGFMQSFDPFGPVFSAPAILKFGDSDRYLKVVKRLGSGTRRRGIMFYGTIVWDPWLILAQIVCLQCLYYLTLGFFTVLLVGTRVSRMSLMYFFDFSMLVASTVTGWCVIVSFILSSLAG